MQRKERDVERERKIVRAQMKIAADDENVIEGYAAVFGNIDDGFDRIAKGAFRTTIKERIKTGKIKLTDSHGTDAARILGTVFEGREDAHGLFVRARVSDDPQAQAIKLKVKEGHIDGMSIGYQALDYKYVEEGKITIRDLREIKLFEVALTAFPMNELAKVTGVKSAALPFQDLPLADAGQAWDAGAARKRVEAWAGGDNINFAQLHRAFLWHNAAAPGDVASYKCVIADVINGHLLAVPRAIFAAATVLQGGRRGVPEADRAKMREHVARYYTKLDRKPPWDRNARALGAVMALVDEGTLELALSTPESRESGRLLAAVDEALETMDRVRADLQALKAAGSPPAAPTVDKLRIRMARNRLALLDV